MLVVEKLHKSYGRNEVLKDISFTVDRGQVFGFLGPNGAGKTTTMNIIAGMISSDSGNVTIDGFDITRDRARLRGALGYLPESPVFYGYMNALEYLLFIGDVCGLGPGENARRADELLALVSLYEARRKRISSFSRGMKQRLGIAAALYDRPGLVLLDEPTSALDPEGRLDVMNLIRQLKDQGTTILLSTHILADVDRTCDSVAIIKDGTLLTVDTVDGLRSRYMQPIVDIVFDAPIDSVPEQIGSSPFVEKAILTGDHLAVYLTDLPNGKRQLMTMLSGGSIGVTSFGVRQPSIEDIFVRLVG